MAVEARTQERETVRVGSNRFTIAICARLPSRVAHAMQADNRTRE
jgi:hypothetical protein